MGIRTPIVHYGPLNFAYLNTWQRGHILMKAGFGEWKDFTEQGRRNMDHIETEIGGKGAPEASSVGELGLEPCHALIRMSRWPNHEALQLCSLPYYFNLCMTYMSVTEVQIAKTG